MSESEKFFYNGDIITMEENLEAEAVLIKNGTIAALGCKEAVLALKTEETELVDLQGKTLMPAFIDAHSHISALTQTLTLVSLSECKSIGEIIDKLKEYRKAGISRTVNGSWDSATTIIFWRKRDIRTEMIWIRFRQSIRF